VATATHPDLAVLGGKHFTTELHGAHSTVSTCGRKGPATRLDSTHRLATLSLSIFLGHGSVLLCFFAWIRQAALFESPELALIPRSAYR